MSQAKVKFVSGIEDAEDLLAHFDTIHKQQPNKAEVLKRAGLIMALTAWETYVEDRVREGLEARVDEVGDRPFADFVCRKLEVELKRFHNPNTDKTQKLFKDYLDVDVVPSWKWNGYDTIKAKQKLDELLAKRGDAVHRSKPPATSTPEPHLVTKDDLR